ncbi:MAG TPA: universal stress protein [Candidatus Binatia bacterium]|jgi:nucleotide-binding universal stress UspA family protein|nr:universal stress protein [Candidatus Binatia bacterium]
MLNQATATVEAGFQPASADASLRLLPAEDGGREESARPIHRILVPSDFSPRSAKALERAIALARQFDATLTILHVIDINPPAAFTHSGTAEDLMKQLWVTGASELSRLEESLRKNQTKVQTLLVEGLPAEAIVENSAAFDLLVISEPRSKSTWNLFSRHTARRVVEQAECPVVVVDQTLSSRRGKQASQAQLACSAAP